MPELARAQSRALASIRALVQASGTVPVDRARGRRRSFHGETDLPTLGVIVGLSAYDQMSLAYANDKLVPGVSGVVDPRRRFLKCRETTMAHESAFVVTRARARVPNQVGAADLEAPMRRRLQPCRQYCRCLERKSASKRSTPSPMRPAIIPIRST